jgi:hypothetical protein
MKYVLMISAILSSTVALADYSTDRAGKKVLCSGPDSSEFELNAKRTRVKFTVEGEGDWDKITGKDGDGDTSVTYFFHQGSITFSDQYGDFFVYDGDDSEDSDNRMELDCE